VGFEPLPPPPPPPQLIHKIAIATRVTNPCQRRLDGITRTELINAAASKAPYPRTGFRCFRPATVPLVETVSTVFSLPLTDAGLKVQVAPEGSPAHDAEVKVIVPLNPPSAVMAVCFGTRHIEILNRRDGTEKNRRESVRA
jgi:hypothetical protein